MPILVETANVSDCHTAAFTPRKASEEDAGAGVRTYIDMVLGSWRYSEEETLKIRQAQHRGPVTDILLWIECYSSIVGVLALKYVPGKQS